MDSTYDSFYQFPSILSVSQFQENYSWCIGNLDEPALTLVISLLPITDVKPSRWIITCGTYY